MVNTLGYLRRYSVEKPPYFDGPLLFNAFIFFFLFFFFLFLSLIYQAIYEDVLLFDGFIHTRVTIINDTVVQLQLQHVTRNN